MHSPRLITAAVVALSAAAAFPAAALAAATAKAKKKTCKTTKDLRTTRCLYGSKWRITAASWEQAITIRYNDGDKSFTGQGTATLATVALPGSVKFPDPKNPVVPWVQNGSLEFKATSTGGWTFTDGRYEDCAWTAPAAATPPGFGGIVSLKGTKISIQWPLGGAGWACDHGIPETEFPTPIQEYSLSRFRGKKSVTLPIRIRNKQVDSELDASQTFDGKVILQRVK